MLNTTIQGSENQLKIAQEASFKTAPPYYGYLNNFLNTVSSDITRLGKLLFSSPPTTNPVTGRIYFPLRAWESKLGSRPHIEKIKTRMEDSEGIPLQTTLDKIVSRLVKSNKDLLNPEGQPELKYPTQITAFLTPNAFAFWGGTVMTSQLFLEIEWYLKQKREITVLEGKKGFNATVSLEGVTRDDVLAFILGHELNHIAAHDVSQSMILYLSSMLALTALGIKFTPPFLSKSVKFLIKVLTPHIFSFLAFCALSRFREFRADATGAFLASRAGYDPRGALCAMALFQDIAPYRSSDMISSHPTSKKRLRALLSSISTYNPSSLAGHLKWEFSQESLLKPSSA